jgi:hypothetical protein
LESEIFFDSGLDSESPDGRFSAHQLKLASSFRADARASGPQLQELIASGIHPDRIRDIIHSQTASSMLHPMVR